MYKCVIWLKKGGKIRHYADTFAGAIAIVDCYSGDIKRVMIRCIERGRLW